MTFCPWPVSYASCPEEFPPDPETEQETALREQMERVASEFLWRWTGKVFGVCPTSVRPCGEDCPSYTSTFWGGGPYPSSRFAGATWGPVLVDGKWYNIRCGTCRTTRCSCGHGDSIEIPGPIDSITTVTIDGEVLDPSAYRVDNRRFLVRTDGGQWPRCQNLDAPATEEDTFLVEYERGTPVPEGGKLAAGRLAKELINAACGRPCDLPERVQSVTRQGVTVAVLDAFEDLDGGRTGIWSVDSWVTSIMQPPTKPVVRSPDYRPRVQRRQTWPATT